MRYTRVIVFAMCTLAILVVLSIGQFPDAGQAQPIPLPGRDDPPRVTVTRPANSEVNVLRNIYISADVTFPAVVGNGVDPNTLNQNTVYLHPTGNPGNKVAAEILTSGGNDSIVLSPDALLASNTQYTFVVTSGVKDLEGNSFQPYSMSFTTGTNDGSTPTPIEFAFTEFALFGYAHKYTSLLIPQDNRLYASTVTGLIRIFDIKPDGGLTFDRDITALQGRTILGFVNSPDSTSNNMTLWVTNNDPYTDESVAALQFTGRISKLVGTNLNTASEQWVKTDYVVGLPRSRKDHLTNGIVYGPDGALYLTQGSNSAMGQKDLTWGNEPETLLSAAVLRIDVAKLEASPRPLDVKTAVVVNNSITQNYGLGEVPSGFYDPTDQDAPLTIFATGVRNAYDLLWHSNGQLYVPTNGSAAGGNVPGYFNGVPCQNRVDKALFGDYSWEGTQPPTVNSVPVQYDYLFRVVHNGYYGHPNPERCEWVANGGNPNVGIDPAEVASNPSYNGYPVGVRPDRNWRGFAFQFGTNISPNGVIEYKSNIYDGALRGRVLVISYAGNKEIFTLTPGGAADNYNIVATINGIPGFVNKPFANPLDLVEDTRNGNLYTAGFGSQTASLDGKISLLKPVNPNAAPLVGNDTYSVVQANPLVVGAANGVLKNDIDQNGDPMSALLWTAPKKAQSFNLNADGSFSYVPVANFSGVDSFTYKTSDAQTTSSVATVTINITPGTPTPTITPGGPTLTPTYTPSVTPTMTLIPPTETPIPVGGRQLVLNGGFEGGMNLEGVPSNWQVNNGKGDKVKCNTADKLVSYKGQCAFMFKKSATEDSRLVQKLDVANIVANDTLVLSFYAQTKKVQPDAARVLLKIRYENGKKKKIKVNLAQGTTPYGKYGDMVVLKDAPTKLKLIVRFNGTKGKYFVDDVSVVLVPAGSAASFSSNPLIDLPQP